MTQIIYGKSTGPRTSKGRRRVRRMKAAITKKILDGNFEPFLRLPKEYNTEKIGLKSHAPRYVLATITDLSFRLYNGNISKDGCDAMRNVVNHAHQRNPKKKWS